MSKYIIKVPLENEQYKKFKKCGINIGFLRTMFINIIKQLMKEPNHKLKKEVEGCDKCQQAKKNNCKKCN